MSLPNLCLNHFPKVARIDVSSESPLNNVVYILISSRPILDRTLARTPISPQRDCVGCILKDLANNLPPGFWILNQLRLDQGENSFLVDQEMVK